MKPVVCALTLVAVLAACSETETETESSEDDVVEGDGGEGGASEGGASEGGAGQGGGSDGGASEGGAGQGGASEGGAGGGGEELPPIDLCEGVDCSGLDSGCTIGQCDPADGACFASPVSDGVTCDDASLCTVDDVCSAGICEGAPVVCSAAECSEAFCDEATGGCVVGDAPDTSVCSDANVCTTQDMCMNGTCGGMPRRSFQMPTVGQQFVISGDTFGKSNDFDASCGEGAGASDHEYRFTIGERRAYEFSTTNTSFESVLHLRNGCDDSSFACNESPTDATAELKTFLDPGDYHVIVDGKGSFSAGTYELNAAPVPHVVGASFTESGYLHYGQAIEFNEQCPAGQVLVGLRLQKAQDWWNDNGTWRRGYYWPAISRFQAQCADYDVVLQADDSYDASVGSTLTALTMYGSDYGINYLEPGIESLVCPAGTAVVGMGAAMGSKTYNTWLVNVRRVTLACGAINPSGNDVTGVTFVGGATSNINAQSDVTAENGSSYNMNMCPAGQVSTALRLNAGSIVEGIGVNCTTPTSVFE